MARGKSRSEKGKGEVRNSLIGELIAMLNDRQNTALEGLRVKFNQNTCNEDSFELSNCRNTRGSLYNRSEHFNS